MAQKPFDVSAPLNDDSAFRIDQDFNAAFDAINSINNDLTVLNGDTVILTTGMPVYAEDANGINLVVKRAKADATSTMECIGLIASDILPGALGPIRYKGILKCSTTGFNAGDVLYVSPSTAGTLTTTRPSGANTPQRVATVITTSTDNGTVFVDIGSASEPPVIGATTQIIFNKSGVLVGDAGLTYDDATETVAIAGSINDYVSLTISNTNAGASAYAVLLLYNDVGDSAGLFMNSDTNGGRLVLESSNTSGVDMAAQEDIRFSTGGSERIRILNNGRVGIGTDSADSKFEIEDATAGTTLQARVTHSNNSNAASHSALHVNTGGSSGGDPVVQFAIASVSAASWTIGVDNSDSDKFKVSNDTTLGSNDRLAILAAGNVGIGTASPATSAMLEIASTTGALLLPRMTTTERNALTAANGMLIYNTTDGKFQGYEAGAWTNLI